MGFLFPVCSSSCLFGSHWLAGGPGFVPEAVILARRKQQPGSPAWLIPCVPLILAGAGAQRGAHHHYRSLRIVWGHMGRVTSEHHRAGQSCFLRWKKLGKMHQDTFERMSLVLAARESPTLHGEGGQREGGLGGQQWVSVFGEKV